MKSLSRQLSANLDHRGDYLWIGLALIAAVWVPLRLTHFMALRAVDLQVDLAVSILALTLMRSDQRRLSLWRFWSGSLNSSLIVGAIPWALLAVAFGWSDSPWLLAPKLLLAPRILRVRRIIDSFDTLHPIAARLVPVAVVAPVVVHILACGWIILGSGSAGIRDSEIDTYVQAIYWAVTTLATVGYGDITPTTSAQMLYASCAMIIGVGFFGFVLSNVASLLARLDASREQYLSILDGVEAFMRYNRIPAATRGRVRGYFRFLWKSRRGLSASSVLSALPQHLRAEIALAMNAGIINKVPLLGHVGPEFLEEIALALEPQVCVPGERIFNIGEAGDAMYFIHTGSVKILAKDGSEVATIREGSFFGERALITQTPRNASAFAVGYCDVFVLRRDAFFRALERYPAFDAKLRAHVEELERQRSMSHDESESSVSKSRSPASPSPGTI